MIRVLIVDDEPLARAGLRALISGEPGVEVAGEAGDGREAVEMIEALDPDLVLLDVQMPGMDGFGVVEHVGVAEMPPVVFITAYEQHAVRAFEVHAVDYVLKPFEDARLLKALRHARHQLRRHPEALAAAAAEYRGAAAPREPRYATWITVPRGTSLHHVRTESVDYFEAAGNYVKVHVGGAEYLLRSTLTEIAASLDPARFVRIHRSTLVNLDRVRETQPWFGGDRIALLHDGRQLRVSRRFRDQLARPLF